MFNKIKRFSFKYSKKGRERLRKNGLVRWYIDKCLNELSEIHGEKKE